MYSNKTLSRIRSVMFVWKKEKQILTKSNYLKYPKYSAIKTNLCAGIRAILSVQKKKTSITPVLF